MADDLVPEAALALRARLAASNASWHSTHTLSLLFCPPPFLPGTYGVSGRVSSSSDESEAADAPKILTKSADIRGSSSLSFEEREGGGGGRGVESQTSQPLVEDWEPVPAALAVMEPLELKAARLSVRWRGSGGGREWADGGGIDARGDTRMSKVLSRWTRGVRR